MHHVVRGGGRGLLAGRKPRRISAAGRLASVFTESRGGHLVAFTIVRVFFFSFFPSFFSGERGENAGRRWKSF